MPCPPIGAPRLSRRALLPALLLPAALSCHPAAASVASTPEEDDADDVVRPLLEVPAFDGPRIALLRALLSSEGFWQNLAGQISAPAAPPASRYAADAAHAGRVQAAYLALAGRALSAAQRAAILRQAPIGNVFHDQRLRGTPAATVSGTDLIDQAARWLRVIGALGTLTPEELRRSPLDEGAAFTALRRQLAQGYTSTPVLAGLPEAERRELGLWLLLNWGDMVAIVLDGIGAGSAPTPVMQALQTHCRALLREFGLDPGALRLSNAGLRRR